MTDRPATVNRLRDATRALHVELDVVSGVLGGGRERYGWFVAKQYGFHAAIEPALARAPGLAELGLELEPRRRSHLFAADLLHLGGHPGRLPRCEALPPLDTTARALGALYALEACSVAGMFLLPHVRAALGVTPEGGASGLAPYGPDVAAMWMGFTAGLERFVAQRPEAEPEILAAAQETFRAMIAWMGGGAAVSEAQLPA